MAAPFMSLSKIIIFILMVGSHVILCYDSIMAEGLQKRVIINIITGGTIDKINHVGSVNKIICPSISYITKRLGSTKCDNTSILALVEAMLEKDGIVNIDLRTDLSESLSKPDMDVLSADIINTERLLSEVKKTAGSEDLASRSESLISQQVSKQQSGGSQTHYNLSIGVNKLDKSKPNSEKGNVEILSYRGPSNEFSKPHMPDLPFDDVIPASKLINEIRGYHSDSPLKHEYDHLLSHILSNSTIAISYMTTVIDLNRKVFEKYTKASFENKMTSPTGICKAYMRSRRKVEDASTNELNFLFDRLLSSLIALREILMVSSYLKSDKYVDPSSYNVSFCSAMMLIRDEVFTSIMKPQYQGRNKRSLEYAGKFSKGEYIGKVDKDSAQFDISNQLNEKLIGKKSIVSSKILLDPELFPACNNIAKLDRDILTSKSVSVLMEPLMSTRGLCFVSKACGPGQMLEPNTLLCQSAGGKVTSSSLSFNTLMISDHINRQSNLELDSSLQRDFMDVCSIGDMTLRQCKRSIHSDIAVTLARIGGEWIILKESVDIGVVADMDSLDSYKCYSSLNKNLIDSRIGCKYGDQVYLSKYKGQDECMCKEDPLAGDINIKYYGKVIPVDFIMNVRFPARYELKIPEVKECFDCRAECREGVLSITNSPQYDLISYCKHGFCEYRQITQQKERFLIGDPGVLRGDVKLTFYSNTTELASKILRINCDIDDQCILIRCTFCFDRLVNPHCDLLITMMIWVGSILGLLSTLQFMVAVFSTLQYVFRILGNAIKFLLRLATLIVRCCIRRTSKQAERVYTSLESQVDSGSIPLVKSAAVEGLKKPVRGPIVLPLRQQQAVLTVLIAIIFLHGVIGCSQEGVISSNSLTCLASENGQSCRIKTNVRIPVAPIGQVACLNIMNPKTGDGIMQIQIKTIGLRLTCNPSVRYYTSNFKIGISSTYRCNSAGSCSEDYCRSVKSNDVLEDIPQKHLFEGLGESGCKLVNGFWGNSCFLAESACKFYRVYFEGLAPTYEVLECQSWEWYANLQVDFVSNKPLSKKILVSSNMPFTTDSLKIALISASVAPSSLFNKCFLRKVGQPMEKSILAMTECNKNTEDIRGKVGEVKCPTINATDYLTTACRSVPGLYTIVTNGNDIEFRSDHIDVDKVYESSLLPIKEAGMMVIQTPNGIPYIDSQSHSFFELNLQMDDYKVGIIETVASCSADFVNVTGCYKCLSGGRLCLDVSSSKYPSVMRVTCPNSISTVIAISSNMKYCFNMHFTAQHLHATCKVSCGDGEADFLLKGNLIMRADPDYQNGNFTVIRNRAKTDMMTDILSWILNFITHLTLPSLMALLGSCLIAIILFYITFRVLLPMILRKIRGLRRKEQRHYVLYTGKDY